ncbi:HdeD family acid-resistance protein [Carboxylicivirga taeanensis]|uniref:HdeD family acid-resistance protein n=1 Tax=Carboxylicivirga taeanensis TaxID=1416875 RepID=UPI003F6DDDDF
MKNYFKYWWLTFFKGIVLLVLAFLAFFQPATMLLGLAVYLGVSLLITGFFETAAAIISRKTNDNFGWHLATGIIDIVFASVLLTNPAITAAVFPFIVGFWIVFYGIMLFTNSFRVKKAGFQNWPTEMVGGILAVIVGYLVMSNPFVGALTVTFWIGLGCLNFGILNLSIAFRLRTIEAKRH